MNVPGDPSRAGDPRDASAADRDMEDDAVVEALLDDAEVAADAADDDEGPHRRVFVLRRDPAHRRLDVYLQQRLRGVSRHQVQKLIAASGVMVNDQPAKSSTKLHQGDRIDVILPPPPIKYLEPQPIPLDVLYEDRHLIVVNKQAGLIVHPARSHLSGTLINGLAYHFQQQAEAKAKAGPAAEADDDDDAERSDVQLSRGARRRAARRRRRTTGVWGLSTVGADDARPGIIHRLDKNTTGVLVVGKSDEAHWQVARQFENRTVLKAYLAVVHGEVDGPGGVIEQPIGKHPTIREAYAVRHDSSGKSAITLYRVRERYRGYCLVELELKTGRTHQIRVHMSYLGNPIVGDIPYGGQAVGPAELADPPKPPGSRRYLTFAHTKEDGDKLQHEADGRDDVIMRSPALHAALLELDHPIRRQRMTFTAPVHEPMATLIRELRRHRIDGPVAQAGFYVDLDEAVPASSDG